MRLFPRGHVTFPFFHRCVPSRLTPPTFSFSPPPSRLRWRLRNVVRIWSFFTQFHSLFLFLPPPLFSCPLHHVPFFFFHPPPRCLCLSQSRLRLRPKPKLFFSSPSTSHFSPFSPRQVSFCPFSVFLSDHPAGDHARLVNRDRPQIRRLPKDSPLPAPARLLPPCIPWFSPPATSPAFLSSPRYSVTKLTRGSFFSFPACFLSLAPF